MRKMRYISPIIFLLALGVGYFLFLTFSGRIDPNPVSDTIISVVRPYPALSGPKTVTLSCAYHGEDVKVSETLYDSLDKYYKDSPAKLSAYYHDQNENFVFSYKQDGTIRDIASKIKQVGTQKGLTADQTLDLAACLMQSIPYDTDKAARILSPDYYKLPTEQLIPRYPYETLYEGLGICTDKSFLGVAVFRELGYSTSLLTFDAQRHMSVGIEVPAGYGDFGTKYAIMELTGANFLVGEVPEISSNAGLAVGGISTLPNVTTDSPVSTEKRVTLASLTKAIPVSGGEIYSRIVDRMALKNQITSLQTQLTNAQQDYNDTKVTLSAKESSLQAVESTYKSAPSNKTYSTYTTAYNSYVQAYNAAKLAVDNYNSLVNKYNSLVAKYREY